MSPSHSAAASPPSFASRSEAFRAVASSSDDILSSPPRPTNISADTSREVGFSLPSLPSKRDVAPTLHSSPASSPDMATAALAPAPSSFPAASFRRAPPPPPLTSPHPSASLAHASRSLGLPPTPTTPSSSQSCSDASDMTEAKLEKLSLAVGDNLRQRPLAWAGGRLVCSLEDVESPVTALDGAGRTMDHGWRPRRLQQAVSEEPSSSSATSVAAVAAGALSPSSFAGLLTTRHQSPPLVLDLRSAASFAEKRVRGSVGMLLPTLILKRLSAGSGPSPGPALSWTALGGFASSPKSTERFFAAVSPEEDGLIDSLQDVVVLADGASTPGAASALRDLVESLLRSATRRHQGHAFFVNDATYALGGLDTAFVETGPEAVEETRHSESVTGSARPQANSTRSASLITVATAPSLLLPPRSFTFPSQGSPLTLSPGLAHTIKPLLSPSAIAASQQFPTQLSPSLSATSSTSASSSLFLQRSPPLRSTPPLLSLNTSPSKRRATTSSASSIVPADGTSDLSSKPSMKVRPPKLSLRTVSGPTPPRRQGSLPNASGGLPTRRVGPGLLISTDVGERLGDARHRTLGRQASEPSNPHLSPSFGRSLYSPSHPPPRTPSLSFSADSDVSRPWPPSRSQSSATSFTSHFPGDATTSPLQHIKSLDYSPPSSASSSSSPQDSTGPGIFVVSTVLPGFLYLGPDPSTPDEIAQLKMLGIERVLNMAVECDDELGMETSFDMYKKIGIRDSVDEMGVAKGLQEACAFLDDARLHSAPTYVHCRAGKSRSVTVVLAYLIHSHRWALNKAYAYVLERRKGISPNIGFMSELLTFEENVLGRPSSAGQPLEERERPALGQGRESLTPAWTTTSGLVADEDLAMASPVAFGSTPPNRSVGFGADELEVRKNGHFLHRQRPSVDETTLSPRRRMSKAGLEGLTGGGGDHSWTAPDFGGRIANQALRLDAASVATNLGEICPSPKTPGTPLA